MFGINAQLIELNKGYLKTEKWFSGSLSLSFSPILLQCPPSETTRQRLPENVCRPLCRV
ncbi:hypothetical protein [Eikenella exigua]|uniref:hypothetical protein n=1 Tax=Eikenella exigua TaxID=2528037 RepID=UPI00142EF14D|nr:hypothetical protein [Eikenella exigua]